MLDNRFAIPQLDVKNVRVTYNNGHTALTDASFSISGGSICALVGVNGSGKSTLFKTIMGLVKPSSGAVSLNGCPIKTALKQNVISYVPQSEEVDWNFPVLVSDVVMMGRYGKMGFFRYPRPIDKEAVSMALDRVGLVGLENRQIGELSGGQKKRVFLARALAQEGKVLLLDEPFTGVDVKTENAIVCLLRQLQAEGHLILVSTHNLSSVPEFCNYTIMINKTVVAQGETKAVFTSENLQKTFGGVLDYIKLPDIVSD